MKMAMAFLYVGLALIAIPTALDGYALEKPVQNDRTGDMNDGNWWCSWMLSGGSCRDGHFNCKCPSDGRDIYFYVGCCYQFPECGVICNTHDCSRYYHCAECRTEIGEWEKQSCSRCIDGFNMGEGDCREDRNECEFLNGNCEQQCHNTYGSYYCGCNDGYQLNEDRHNCQRLSCPAPDSIEFGAVSATENWLYSSYARYVCTNQQLHILIGPVYRQCVANGQLLYWQNEQPRCTDVCDNVAIDERRACGWPDIAPGNCVEMGCCYRAATGGPSCFGRPVPMYLSYAGDRPNNGDGFVALQDYGLTGCAFHCSQSTERRCRSFGLRRTGYDASQSVQRQSCQMLDKSRRQFINDEELVHGDPDYDLYDQLDLGAAAVKKQTNKQNDLDDKLYVGCYRDNSSRRDMEFFLWHDFHNTPLKCIAACRQQGYKYAGLQNTYDCYCSNSVTRIYDEDDTACTTVCSGDLSTMCGGTLANSVYNVPSDSRYVGCYSDVQSDPDLPVLMWTENEALYQSAVDCVTACQRAGFSYAGVQNGGRCYCGNTFGRHGGVTEDSCSMHCTAGWINQNCGGENSNAIYNTERGVPLGIEPYDINTRKLYIADEHLNGIPLVLFTEYPRLKSVISKRLIIHATEKVSIPAEDRACWLDCYTKCGEIYHPDGLEYKGRDLVLRFFFINLNDLEKYVGLDAERVFVYAQTVLIQNSLSFPFSLQIRARQIIINRGTAQMLSVGSRAPIFNYDYDIVKDSGPPVDDLFVKQSFMCARILLDTRGADNMNTAWSILHDMTQGVQADVTSVEQTTWAYSVRMFNSFLSGIERQNTYFVPFYSKSYFSEILRLYYDQITIYKNDYDRLLSDTISDAEYIRNVEEMLNIQSTTDVAEAQSTFDAALSGVLRSNATYYRLKAEYDKARDEVEQAREEFENSLESSITFRDLMRAVLNFVKALKDVYYGIQQLQAKKVQRDLENELLRQLDLLAESMENLALGVEETERFMVQVDYVVNSLQDPTSNYDYTRFMADVEMTVTMQVNIIRWQNLKNNVLIILTNEQVNKLGGCSEYMRTVLDLINWGEAVTRSTVEHAEIVRDCIQKKYALDSKLEQAKRYDAYLAELKAGSIDRQVMTARMAEQQYDVRLDLNNVLVSFCQAYFYENMFPCKDNYKPSFGGSLTELLIKINLAVMDSILVPNPPSTVSRIVRVQDTDTSPECSDMINCPIRYFRNTGTFYYKLLIDHPQLRDLDRYRVHEIVLNFVGAQTNKTTLNDLMKVRIESSGPFRGREKGQIFDFITRALSLTFEYSLDTGHISIRANVYEPYRDTVQHITPYTTWIMRLSELSQDINISEVTQITMRLDGSAIDNEVKRVEMAQDVLDDIITDN